MIIHEHPQGSPEWLQARCGGITASMFTEVRKVVNGLSDKALLYANAILGGVGPIEAAGEIAGYANPETQLKKFLKDEKMNAFLKGERVGNYSKTAEAYAFRLAIERISGKTLDEDGFQNFAMRRGNELEPDARWEHEQVIGKMIEQVGYVSTDDGHYGASADGYIDVDGGAEYKCLIDPDRIKTIVIDKDLEQFMDQVQGCMWLTGRKWWHFCLYCPALRPIGKQLFIIEVERDDDYIEKLEIDLVHFNTYVEECKQKLIDYVEPPRKH